MHKLHSLRSHARMRLRQSWMQFPNTTRIAAPILQDQKPPHPAACFRRAAKTRRHSQAMRLEHHWTHLECRCTRTYDVNGSDFSERTISKLKLKTYRREDHYASCFSMRSTNAAPHL